MIKRTATRVVPNKPHYTSLTIEGIGEVHWRLPCAAYALLLVQLMNRDNLIDKSTAIQSGDADAAADMSTKMMDLYSIQGAVIGLCWFHKEYDLETAKGRLHTPEALLDYGEQVYEELYEAEWTSAQIVQTWSQLLPKVLETLVDQGKGIEKVNFTPAQQEHPAS